ncbi:hypothetical protein BH11ARM2_BH11ARM2_26750 [soil metagenome]
MRSPTPIRRLIPALPFLTTLAFAQGSKGSATVPVDLPIWVTGLLVAATLAGLGALLVSLSTLKAVQRREKRSATMISHPDPVAKLPDVSGMERSLSGIDEKLDGHIQASEMRSQDMKDALDRMLKQTEGLLNPRLVSDLKEDEAERNRLVTSLRTAPRENDERAARLQAELGTESTARAQIERERDEAKVALTQARAEATELSNRLGLGSVAATRTEIQNALGTAGARMKDTPAARRSVEEDADILRAGLAAVEAGDVRGLTVLLSPTAFDPFLYPQAYWEAGMAAKRTLENAREAILALAANQGFEVIRPVPGQDRVQPDRHAKVTEVTAETPDLAGKVARLRRLGLAQNGRVIEPARVDIYVFDPAAKAAQTPAPPTATPPSDSAAALAKQMVENL